MRRFLFLILVSGLSLSLLSAAQSQQPQQPNEQPSAQQPANPPSAQEPSQSSGQPGAQQPAQPPASPNDQPNAQQPSAQPGAPPADAGNKQSVQTMHGKIARAGNQLVFQEGPSQTAFQMDDQSKAAPFEGKSVKVSATIDPKTSTLHVIEIGPSEK